MNEGMKKHRIERDEMRQRWKELLYEGEQIHTKALGGVSSAPYFYEEHSYTD